MEIEHWCPICDRQILPAPAPPSSTGMDIAVDPSEVTSPTGEETQTPPTTGDQTQTKANPSRTRQTSPTTVRKKATATTGGGTTKGSRPSLHRSRTTHGNIHHQHHHHHHKRKPPTHLGDINLAQDDAIPPVPVDDDQQDREEGTAAGAKTSRIGMISREEPHSDAGAPMGAGDEDGEVVVLRRTRRDRVHSLGRMKAMPLPALGPEGIIDENTVAPPVARPKTSGKSKTGIRHKPKPLNLTSAEYPLLTGDKTLFSGSNANHALESNGIITPITPIQPLIVPEYLQASLFCSEECYNVALQAYFSKVQQGPAAGVGAESEVDHGTLSFRRAPGSLLSSSTPLMPTFASDGGGGNGETTPISPLSRLEFRIKHRQSRPKISSGVHHDNEDGHATAASSSQVKKPSTRRRSGMRRHSVAVCLEGHVPTIAIDRPWWVIDEEEDWESYCLARETGTTHRCTSYDQWKTLRHQQRVQKVQEEAEDVARFSDSRAAAAAAKARKRSLLRVASQPALNDSRSSGWRDDLVDERPAPRTRESSTTVSLSSSGTRSSSSVATPLEMAIPKPLPPSTKDEMGNHRLESSVVVRKRRNSRRLPVDLKGFTPLDGQLTKEAKGASTSSSNIQLDTGSIRRNAARVLPPLVIKTHVSVGTSPTTPSKPVLSPKKLEGYPSFGISGCSSPEPVTTATGSSGSGSSGEESSGDGSQTSPRKKSTTRSGECLDRPDLPYHHEFPLCDNSSKVAVDYDVERMEPLLETGSPVVSFLRRRVLSTILRRF